MWWAGAADELRALADRGIPVVTRQAARGTLPDDHPICFGRDWQNVVFQADVCSSSASSSTTSSATAGSRTSAHLVQVDIEASEIGRNRVPVSVGIVADAKPAVRRRSRTRCPRSTRRGLGRTAARAGR